MASLRDRLLGRTQAPAPVDGDGAEPPARPAPTAPPASVTAERLTRTVQSRRIEVETLSPVDQLKVDLHRRLIERLDLEALERIDDENVLILQIRNAVAEFLRGEQTPLSQAEREEVIEQIIFEVTGLGPIEPFFRDKTISDILVNGPKEIYIERRGRLARV
ncbi:MAG: hypothetical protein ACRENH_02285, partial [Gemmatimonadaceae bacterium]